MADNPFEKKKSKPVQQEPDPASICPFLGVIPTPVLNQGAILKPGGNPLDAMQMAGTPMPCQGALCVMWDTEAQTCSVRVGVNALVALKERLSKLPF